MGAKVHKLSGRVKDKPVDADGSSHLRAKTCVTYVCDSGYLPLVASSLLSLWASTPIAIDVAVFLIDVPTPMKADVAAFFSNLGQPVEWIDLDLHDHIGAASRLPPTLKRIPLATFGRLVVNDILQGFDQHIYLDGDTLVFDDINTLADCSTKVFAAVNAGWTPEKNRVLYDRNGLPPVARYFNAGVYVLNSAYWREENITRRCVEMAANANLHLPLADQDILNLLLGDKCDWLDARWNFKKEQSWEMPNESPWIVHFAGRLKPWDTRDPRTPVSTRQLYSALFELLPRTLRDQVSRIALTDREFRRATRKSRLKWVNGRARQECWDPSHDKVLAQCATRLKACLSAL